MRGVRYMRSFVKLDTLRNNFPLWKSAESELQLNPIIANVLVDCALN
jgi:hypothetical protein